MDSQYGLRHFTAYVPYAKGSSRISLAEGVGFEPTIGY
jgi:hypothetical protein